MLASGLALIETPIALQDIFVSELVDVEHVGGGVYRFTFATKYTNPMTSAEVLEPKARLVLPASSVFRAAIWALKAIGARCCGAFVMDRCSLH